MSTDHQVHINHNDIEQQPDAPESDIPKNGSTAQDCLGNRLPEVDCTNQAAQNVPTSTLPSLEEVMELNKLWKQEYDLLQKQFKQMKAQLQEDNLKLKQEVSKTELRCAMLETKNLTLQSELIRLARMFEAIHPHQNLVSSKPGKDSDNVDLIKEQLHAYKEDFKLEHQDRKKIQSEKQSLEEELLQCQKHLHTLNKELELYKKECKRLHEERGSTKQLLRHHITVDRSNSYPSTGTEVPLGSVSEKDRDCFDETRTGYLNLEEFRHEQFKRGILVRNPAQAFAPPPSAVHLQVTPSPPRRRSDSSRPEPTNTSSSPSLSRTSCLW